MVDMLPPSEHPDQLPLWDDDDEDPTPDWGATVGDAMEQASTAMTHITGVLQRLADSRQEPPSDDELRGWLSVPPVEWPGTPSLSTWAALDRADDQLRYEVPEGHLRNLLDEAVAVLQSLGVLDS